MAPCKNPHNGKMRRGNQFERRTEHHMAPHHLEKASEFDHLGGPYGF